MLAPEYLGPTQTGHQTISTANTSRNGTGTIADLATMTAAASGGRSARRRCGAPTRGWSSSCTSRRTTCANR
jgi:hypothetical protein